MKNRGSTLIFTSLVEVHPTFEANLCSGLRKSRKRNKVHADDRHRMIASRTHSLNVTNKSCPARQQSSPVSVGVICIEV